MASVQMQSTPQRSSSAARWGLLTVYTKICSLASLGIHARRIQQLVIKMNKTRNPAAWSTHASPRATHQAASLSAVQAPPAAPLQARHFEKRRTAARSFLAIVRARPAPRLCRLRPRAGGRFNFNIRHHTVLRQRSATCESSGSGSPLNSPLNQLPASTLADRASQLSRHTPAIAGAFQVVVMQQKDLTVFRQFSVKLNHGMPVSRPDVDRRQGVFRRRVYRRRDGRRYGDKASYSYALSCFAIKEMQMIFKADAATACCLPSGDADAAVDHQLLLTPTSVCEVIRT